MLQWSNYEHFPAGTVDVVIGSDCLFFKDFHDALVGMLYHILDKEGVVILLQPSRGGSMELFKEKSETFFDTEQYVDYHPEVRRLLICPICCPSYILTPNTLMLLAVPTKRCIPPESRSCLLIRSPLSSIVDPSAETPSCCDEVVARYSP